MTTTREQLHLGLDQLLDTARFKDYGPNGLQVEGKPIIKHLVSGVTASAALINAAIEARADALVVHHGLFWRGQSGLVTGWMRQRLAALLQHDINLLAYHLPLDAHPTLGNNAQLGQHLGLSLSHRFGDQDIGMVGHLPQPMALATWCEHLQRQLARPITAIPGDGRPIQRVAWCSGGAQSYFEAAITTGIDAYLTGELSEPQTHLARETGVAFIAGGHHATERYGIAALGQWAQTQWGLTHTFIDIDNPA